MIVEIIQALNESTISRALLYCVLILILTTITIRFLFKLFESLLNLIKVFLLSRKINNTDIRSIEVDHKIID